MSLRTSQTGSKHARFTTILEDIGKYDWRKMELLSQRCRRLQSAVGNTVYIAGEMESSKSVPFACPDMEFDKVTANSDICRVTQDGCLINVKDKTTAVHPDRFRMYRGTRGSVSFLPISLDPWRPVLPKYWETHIHGWLRKRMLVWRTFFEVSLVEESHLDEKYMASNQTRSWSVTMADCTIHEGLCTKVYEEGDLKKCIPNMSRNETNTLETQTFGTVVDTERGRLAFLDLTRLRTIHVYRVRFRERVYPLFGMWSYPGDYTVMMELSTGNELQISEEKLKLIHKVLV